MLYTREWVLEKYNECNEKYFEGKLPKIALWEIKLTKNKNPWGRGGCKQFVKDPWTGEYQAKGVHLELSNYYDTDERDKLEVLVHEMCHIYEYFVEPKYYIECVIKRRWTPNHPKHGHGIVFYQQAQRLEKYGFHVQRFVDKETHKNAEVSDDIARKNQGRLDAGIHVLKFKLREPCKGRDYGYVVCSMSNYREWVEHAKKTNYFTEVHDCLTHDKAILAYPSSKSVRRFRLVDGPFDKILERVIFDSEVVIRDDYGDKSKVGAEITTPKTDIPKPQGTTLPEPGKKPSPLSTFLYGNGGNPHLNQKQEPKTEKRYSFAIKTVDKWGRESAFQVKNATEEEAKEQMRQRFPKWTEERINAAFKKYAGIMEENIKLNDNDIKEIVEQVVERVRAARENDDELKAAIANMPDVLPGHIDDN